MNMAFYQPTLKRAESYYLYEHHSLVTSRLKTLPSFPARFKVTDGVETAWQTNS